MTYPLPVAYGTGSTVSATALNNTNSLVNLIWQLLAAVPMMPSAHVATTGVETFTIVSGSVTTIAGTTVDGVTNTGGNPLAVNDYILIKDAPATSGTGSPNSTEPANGLYQITAISTNLTVARATQMSASGAASTPAGMLIGVMAGTVNEGLAWFVASPSSPSASFTYGTTSIEFFQAIINPLEVITLQNKRITKRVGTLTSSATPAIDTDNYDTYKITALATNITGWTITGTPNDRDEFTLTITDNGTSRSLGGWSSWAVTSGTTSFPISTPAGKKLTLRFIYDADYTVWVLVAIDSLGYS